MTTRYLLPCACGNQLVIEPRQAGQQAKCTCGRSLEVPTMLKMAELSRAESQHMQPSRPSAAWGWRQSIVMVGIAIVLGTIVVGIHVVRSRPRPPSEADAEKLRELSRQLTPIETWRRWRYFRVNGLDRQRLQSDEDYQEENLRWWSKVGVVLSAALVGLGLIVGGLLIRRQWPQQRAPG